MSSSPSQKDQQNHRLPKGKGPWHRLVQSPLVTNRWRWRGLEEGNDSPGPPVSSGNARPREAPRNPSPVSLQPLPQMTDFQRIFTDNSAPTPTLNTFHVLILSSLRIKVTHPGHWTLSKYQRSNCGSKTPQSPDFYYIKDDPICWLIRTGPPSPCPFGKNNSWRKKLNCDDYTSTLSFPSGFLTSSKLETFNKYLLVLMM